MGVRWGMIQRLEWADSVFSRHPAPMVMGSRHRPARALDNPTSLFSADRPAPLILRALAQSHATEIEARPFRLQPPQRVHLPNHRRSTGPGTLTYPGLTLRFYSSHERWPFNAERRNSAAVAVGP
jgi:hypothetical protein